LYHQIYLILRQKIVDGIYPFDGRLPGEQDLVEIYGVSRITAKRALDELAAEGLVVRERGRGTRVRYRAPTAPLRSSVEGLLENLLAMGLETEVKLIEFDYVAASEPVAVALECGPGDLVQRALRVRMIDGQPFSHLTTYVPEDIGRQFDAADLSETALSRCWKGAASRSVRRRRPSPPPSPMPRRRRIWRSISVRPCSWSAVLSATRPAAPLNTSLPSTGPTDINTGWFSPGFMGRTGTSGRPPVTAPETVNPKGVRRARAIHDQT